MERKKTIERIESELIYGYFEPDNDNKGRNNMSIGTYKQIIKNAKEEYDRQ